MSTLGETSRNPEYQKQGTEKIQEPGPDAQHWLWEQQENQAHAV